MSEPEPFDVVEGSSPLIFLGPHNGAAVPAHLYDEENQPLGLSDVWFDVANPGHRHEACDWGIQPLFNALMDGGSEHNFIWGNYSRLVTDLNRVVENDRHITELSSDNGDIIPMNENPSADDIAWRLEHIYRPYERAVDELISNVQAEHGGAIILDMHSFHLFFGGKDRDKEIGTLTLEGQPVHDIVVSYLQDQLGNNFGVNYPYQPGNHPSPNRALSEKFNIHYTCLEIRSDSLQQDARLGQIAEMVDGLSDVLVTHSDQDQLLRRDSDVALRVFDFDG